MSSPLSMHQHHTPHQFSITHSPARLPRVRLPYQTLPWKCFLKYLCPCNWKSYGLISGLFLLDPSATFNVATLSCFLVCFFFLFYAFSSYFFYCSFSVSIACAPISSWPSNINISGVLCVPFLSTHISLHSDILS